MKYFLRKRKLVKECDCAPCDAGSGAVSSAASINADLSMGMGPVRIGGPDKFDNIIGAGVFPDHNVKTRKIKMRKRK